MRDAQKGQEFGSFAHFVSCWWSRALSLLALQGALRQEAVSFERLLRYFLNLSQLAQRGGVLIAYEYDRSEWASLAARIECKDEVQPDDVLRRLNTDTRRDVKDLISRSRNGSGSDQHGGKGKGSKNKGDRSADAGRRDQPGRDRSRRRYPPEQQSRRDGY